MIPTSGRTVELPWSSSMIQHHRPYIIFLYIMFSNIIQQVIIQHFSCKSLLNYITIFMVCYCLCNPYVIVCHSLKKSIELIGFYRSSPFPWRTGTDYRSCIKFAFLWKIFCLSLSSETVDRKVWSQGGAIKLHPYRFFPL